MDDETRDVVEDTDADTRDVIDNEGEERNEIVEDTDADTRDVDNRLDELVRKIDALADLVGRISVQPTGNSANIPDGFVSIDNLNLD